MARAMFNYTKEILEKVSFDPSLFAKELDKAIKSLLPHEIEELYFFVAELATCNPDLERSLYQFNFNYSGESRPPVL